jgi:hypothetical protein
MGHLGAVAASLRQVLQAGEVAVPICGFENFAGRKAFLTQRVARGRNAARSFGLLNALDEIDNASGDLG